MAQKVCAAVYCRLAHEDSIAMECQKYCLRRWAVDNGYNVVDEITEVGSGIRLDRPGLTKVMRAIQEKGVDTLVVKNLDRLVRKSLDAYQILEILKEKGVNLICVDEEPTIDLTAIRFEA